MEIATQQTLSTCDVNPILRKVVEELFDEMLMTHGKKFVDQWIVADTERLVLHWCRELVGFTPREFKRGVEAQKTLDWPPTLPEFKKLCRPSIDPELAYHEAYEQGIARDGGKPNVWSSKVVYWAWRAMGSNVFREQSYPQMKTRWIKALADQASRGELPDIPPMVLSVGVDMKSTEINVRIKAELEKQLKAVIKTPESKVDHLRWARVIVDRVARGDRRVPLFTLKAAQEALGLH